VNALLFRFGALLAIIFLQATHSFAATEPSAQPQFRVEGGMHTTTIMGIRADLAHKRIISISLDRTVRIWQLPGLRLVRTIYVPSEGVLEGQLYALAVSPDGQTIAVAGWTGWEWNAASSVYLLDMDSGEIRSHIPGLPSIVGGLDYSPDGRWLAVGMHGGKGVEIYDAHTLQRVAQDREYAGRVSYLVYSKDNKLAVSAMDGFIRLYDAQHKLMGRQSIGFSRQLNEIRFSPDGKKIAFGVVDKAVAAVISADDMALLEVKQIKGEHQQASLCCPDWSHDGEYLYLHGRYLGEGATPIYRWSKQGAGTMDVWKVGTQNFTNTLQLPGGELVFSTDTPSIGVADASGKLIALVHAVTGDFREGGDRFQVSVDGRVVMLPMSYHGETVAHFSMDDLRYDTSTKGTDKLLAPLRDVRQWRLENWKNNDAPILNGTKIILDPFEKVHSYAISHDLRHMVLGTEWALYLFDETGHQVWRTRLQGVARNVNITGDGRFVVATLSDGTVRWFDRSTGIEVLALFAHKNLHDWVLWRPDGYYASSENGDAFVGWLVNRSKTEVPDFYKAVQFERLFYRPDLVKNQLANQAVNATRPLATTNISIDRLAEFAPPRIKIKRVNVNEQATSNQITVEFEVKSSTLPMQDLAVYLNGIPITPARQRALGGRDTLSLQRSITLDSYDKENTLRIEASNGTALGLAETFVESGEAPGGKAPKGNLYLLAIGADHYVNIPPEHKAEVPDLEFASRDAQELVRHFKQQAGTTFRNVYTKLLNDTDTVQKATKANILKALSFVGDAGAHDTVVLFLASHGFSDKAGNYYFLNTDAMLPDLRDVFSGKNVTGRSESLVSWQDFFDALRKSAGKRLLVVDTCQAKNITGTFDAHSLKKRSAASLFALVAASKGDESSQEYALARHGLFTYAFLQGLQGKADRNADGVVSLIEAFAYTQETVERLRDAKESQTPQILAPNQLPYMALSSGK
jgi:WD40 repeat protein